MIFKGKKSRRFHNLIVEVDPGYKYNENFRGGVRWYTMESEDFVSIIGFIKRLDTTNYFL